MTQHCEFCGADTSAGEHTTCPMQLYGTTEQEKRLAKRVTALERQVRELKGSQTTAANVGQCAICRRKIFIDPPPEMREHGTICETDYGHGRCGAVLAP